MAKNTKSAKNTKKAFQSALMQKAAAKAASSNAIQTDASVEVASPDAGKSTKHNEEAFKKALDQLLSTYPANGRNKRTDFSTVLSLLLKMNVDIKSNKEISAETEKALNILGFSTNKSEGKENICKDEIPELVVYLFNGYQKEHPLFCAIDADILHNCPNELDSISKKVWHPIIRYIVCQTASYMTEEDAKHLMSGKSEEITDVLKNVKCAEQTRSVLASIAFELGKLVLTLKASTPVQEVVHSGNCPFAGLNPNDFPSYEEEQPEKVTVIDEVYPEDRVSSPQFVVEEENVKEEEVPEVETTPAHSSITTDIASKQNNSIDTLFHTVKVLKAYGDQLRSLEAEGFVIEDAQALVEANALGFSFNELLHNEKMVETLSSIVNSLK